MNKIEFNTQICTTIEQSKRLLELGLKPETSDMHYVRKTMDAMGNHIDDDFKEPCFGNVNSKYAKYAVMNFSNYETLPAWSLHRLITMFPYKVNKSSNDASLLEITRIKDNCYIAGYYGYKVVEMPLFDAVIRLIEELIKDNIFNKEYLK